MLLFFHPRTCDSAQGWRSTCSPWVAGAVLVHFCVETEQKGWRGCALRTWISQTEQKGQRGCDLRTRACTTATKIIFSTGVLFKAANPGPALAVGQVNSRNRPIPPYKRPHTATQADLNHRGPTHFPLTRRWGAWAPEWACSPPVGGLVARPPEGRWQGHFYGNSRRDAAGVVLV